MWSKRNEILFLVLCCLLDHCFINKESSIIVDQYLSVWSFFEKVSMIDGLKWSLLRCLTFDHQEFSKKFWKRNFARSVDFVNFKVQQENQSIQEIQDNQSVLNLRFLKVSFLPTFRNFGVLSDRIWWETYCFIWRCLFGDCI